MARAALIASLRAGTMPGVGPASASGLARLADAMSRHYPVQARLPLAFNTASGVVLLWGRADGDKPGPGLRLTVDTATGWSTLARSTWFAYGEMLTATILNVWNPEAWRSVVTSTNFWEYPAE